MFESSLQYPLWFSQRLAVIGWAMVSLNAAISLSCASKLMSLPKHSAPLLRLQIERMKLNASRTSHKQQHEHNVLLLRAR